MKIEAIGFSELHKSLQAATESLRLNASLLDGLNVFPVPDGDTGVNLLSTLRPAVEAIGDSSFTSLPALLAVLTDQANRSSRGNSGFILARFLSGLSESAAENTSIRADTLARGFAHGSYLAKSSLLAPVEGTMITIIAAMAEAMAGLASEDILALLRCALACGRQRIFETPSLLPVLARAGVVDAGGLGFVLFVDGLLRGLTGEPIPIEMEADYRFLPQRGSPQEEPVKLTFKYCTELTVEKTCPVSIPEFGEFLKRNGDSVALFDEKQILKLHIHCDDPDRIIGAAERMGTIVRTKIDDMAEQLNRGFRPTEVHEQLAILAVIPGPGYEAIFRELEAGEFLQYCERLPSAGEILQALERVDADHVILLPNEKNVIPAAMAAREKSSKNVFVLPTENVVQGITALYNYKGTDSPERNIRSMKQALGLANCLKVYKSGRDSDYGEVRIRKNDYFVVERDSVLAAEASLARSVCRALSKLDLSEKASVSFYYGEGFDPGLLPEMAQGLQQENGHLEVEQHFGGQHGCELIIAVE
jgi:DAK2 domain fusion protein YloV